jgi:two-component system, NtrC family, nitrogen regulation sensor histidine kinase NtrY
MRYKTKLLAYIIVLNLLLMGLSALFTDTNMKLFMALEVVIVLALILGLSLFRQFSGTMDLIASGIESLKDQDFSIKLKPGKNREFNAFIGVYNKMIDQLRKERIAFSEKSFLITKLMEASPTGILIFDFDNRLNSLNPSARKFIGSFSDNLENLKLGELSVKTGGMFDKCATSNNYIFYKNGSEAYRIQNGFFVDRGFDTRFILIEELTHEIYKTEKQAYDKVIRMMSHEINNSIAAVNSVLHTIRPKLEKYEGYAQTVDVCISRNENLNRFMSNFADVVRIPEPKLKPVDLNLIAGNTLLLFQKQHADFPVSILTHLDLLPVMINADDTQIEQVLMNILKNACEAIENEGRIEVITINKPATLIVRNNGREIDNLQREKLFTPFYSTKSHGQGIGLTLSREILLNHKCRFELKTNPENHLTEFTIVF